MNGMSTHLVTIDEDASQRRPSGLNRTFRVSLKQLLVLILIIVLGSASFFWASDRIATHERWASEIEMSQQFNFHFTDVYVRLPSITENYSTDPTHFWFLDELEYSQ